MELSYLIGALVYLVLSVTVVGVLPSEFFVGDLSGLRGRSLDDSGLRNAINASDSDPGGVVANVGFFYKVAKFMFVTWSIAGIPAIIGVMLFLVNLVSFLVPIVFVYDKIRGI